MALSEKMLRNTVLCITFVETTALPTKTNSALTGMQLDPLAVLPTENEMTFQWYTPMLQQDMSSKQSE